MNEKGRTQPTPLMENPINKGTMNVSEVKTGRDLIKHLEEHCGEELKCSTRLRFLITESISRLIKERDSIKSNVIQAVNGMSTYNANDYTLRTRNKN